MGQRSCHVRVYLLRMPILPMMMHYLSATALDGVAGPKQSHLRCTLVHDNRAVMGQCMGMLARQPPATSVSEDTPLREA